MFASDWRFPGQENFIFETWSRSSAHPNATVEFFYNEVPSEMLTKLLVIIRSQN